MAHVPHVYLPAPWAGSRLAPSGEQVHHLERVLRVRTAGRVSYTDGAGQVGTGTLEEGGIRRGSESRIPRPEPALTVAVAPPRSANRVRLIVEKLGELGVDHLQWLITEHGQTAAPRPDKVARWAIAALEQSRGAWLMTTGASVTSDELPPTTWVLEAGGGPLPEPPGDVTLAIGPEGGFSLRESAHADIKVGLGARVLRVETAAIVASGLVLSHLGRMNT